MAGRERVIENDGWHWEESPEGPQGAITCLIPLQINAGTNPKTDTSRQNLIRLPFLSSPSKLCPLTWQPWSSLPVLFTSLRTPADSCRLQSEADVSHAARSLAPLLACLWHREAQTETHLNPAGLGADDRSNDTSSPPLSQTEKLMSTLLLPAVRRIARGSKTRHSQGSFLIERIQDSLSSYFWNRKFLTLLISRDLES